MAKSSKKQCRMPKPGRRSGGFVVVSAHDLHKPTSENPTKSRRHTDKRKRKRAGNHPSDLEEWNGADSGIRGASQPVQSPGSKREYVFASSHERQERLYYLLRVQCRASGAVGRDVLVVREAGCHALIFVKTTSIAQELLAKLKALNLTAFSIHERTPKAQIKDRVKRFLHAISFERSAALIVTDAAVGRPLSLEAISPLKGMIIRVVHYDDGQKIIATRKRFAARVVGCLGPKMIEEIYFERGENAAELEPFAFESACMDHIRSRLAVAGKLARALETSVEDEGDKSMQRAASAAGLDWDGDSTQGGSVVNDAKCKRRCTQAQQVAALREKIRVLLCRPLLPDAMAVPVAGNGSSITPTNQQPSKLLRKKMVLLRMILKSEAVHTCANGASEERCKALSRWLGVASEEKFSRNWEGRVRVGASCDGASLAVRSLLEAAKQTAGRVDRKGDDQQTEALRLWNPRPDTPDDERWGGRWGKPCGHNEVVLQHLRPFAPIEVLNTRVCSKMSPAPGNEGFDGCLEFLSLMCRAHGRALTLWDNAAFHFITSSGVCSVLPKQTMLCLSLPTIRFLVKNMESFTICCDGQKSPRDMAMSVMYLARWGAKQSRFGQLNAALSTRVMSYVLSGDLADWRAVSKMRAQMGQPSAASESMQQQGKLIFADAGKRRKRFNL